MAQIFKNNIAGVLATGLTPASTSMTLLDASAFPTPAAGDFYLLTLIGINANGQESSWEIVKVTSKASNTLTVERAQEGTTAANWPAATTVQLRLTAESVMPRESIQAALAATAPLTHVGAGAAAHSAATTSTAGFMSGADKTKLDGIEAGANAYTHPASHPPSIIAQDASNRFVTDAEKSTWNGKADGMHSHSFANITDKPTTLAGYGITDAQVDGNLNIAGTARRITGDFGNATVANRVMFQTNVLNGATVLGVIANGTSKYTAFDAYGGSNPDNASYTRLFSNEIAEVAGIDVGKTGTGAYRPFVVVAGGAERLRINPTTGNVTVTSGALGYGVGAGGTASQPGQNSGNQAKNLTVTLNKPSGQITMGNGALGANTAVTFPLNNTIINGESDLLIKVKGGSVDNAAYQVWAFGAAVGSISIAVRNISSVTLYESVVLEFKVVQGANS